MKKVVVLLVLLIICVSIVGCENNKNLDLGNESSENNSTTDTVAADNDNSDISNPFDTSTPKDTTDANTNGDNWSKQY